MASAASSTSLYIWFESFQAVLDLVDESNGVRPVVVLKPGVKFAADGKDGKSESTAFNLVAA